MTPSRQSATECWPELGSREDADRTHAWARELMLMWEAEKAALEGRLEAVTSEAAAKRFSEALLPGYIVWYDGKRLSAEDSLTQIRRGLIAAAKEVGGAL